MILTKLYHIFLKLWTGKCRKIQVRSPFITKAILLSFLSISPIISFSQNENILIFENATVSEIIKSLESELNIVINYSSSVTDHNKKYTYSVSGDKEKLLYTSLSIIDRDIKSLDTNVYALRNKPLPSDKFIAPLTYRISVIENDYSAIPYCNVEVGKQVLESDSLGHVILEGYFSETTAITFSLMSYEQKSILVADLSAYEINNIVLEPRKHTLGEIIIRDNYRSVAKIENGSHLIIPDRINLAGTSDNDGLALSQMVAGVYNGSESLNDIQIRGGTPGQTQYTWNGIRVYQTSLFYGKVSSINPLMTDKITVNKDGGTSGRSNTSPGAINMESDMSGLSKPSFRFYSDLIYFNAAAGISFNKEKIKLKAAYRRSYSTIFKSQRFNNLFNNRFQIGRIPDNEFFVEKFELDSLVTYNSDFGFKDLSTHLSWDISDRLSTSISYFSVSNELSYTQENVLEQNSPGEFLDISNIGIASNTKMQISENYKIDLFANRSFYNYNYLDYDNYLNIEESNERNQVNSILQNKVGLKNSISFKNHEINFGYQYEYWDVALNDIFNNQLIDIQYSQHNKKAYEHSLFVEENWTYDALHLSLSGSWSDYHLSEFRGNFIEPRLHLSYHLSSTLNIHAHYGHYHQVLNRYNIFTPLQADNNFWYLSDESTTSAGTGEWIAIVTSKQYSLGLIYKKGNWQLETSLYQKNIFDLWTAEFDFTYEENPYQYVDSRSKGIEFSLQYRKKNLELKATSEYMDEVITFEDNRQIRSPYYQPFRLGVYANYSFGGFNLGCNFNLATGRYFSIPSGFSTEIDNEGNEIFTVIFDDLLTGQNLLYHRLDISADFTWKMKQQELQVGFNIINIYDRKNELSNQYYTDYRLEDISPSLYTRFGLGITPDLFLKFTF